MKFLKYLAIAMVEIDVRLSALLLVFILFCVTDVMAEESVLITNGEWPPYLSEHLPANGAASRIVELAFKAEGVDVEYIFRPWKRSYKYAVAGRAEDKPCLGTVVWVYSEERAKKFYYSDPVIEEIQVLFHLKKKPLTWSSIEDLSGKIIGGTAHTIYPVFEDAASKKQLVLERAGNYDTLFMRLLAGRIDAIPQVKHVGEYFLKNSLDNDDRAKITYSPVPVEQRKYHLIISKNHAKGKHFLQIFNRGLGKIKADGTYQKIIKDLENGFYY